MAHQPTGIYLGYSPIHLMGYFKDTRADFSSRNFLNQVQNIEQPHLQQIAAETLHAEAVNRYEDHVYEISRVMMSKDEVILKLQQENLELRQKNYELQQENIEVHQKNYELQQQLSSVMNGGGTPPPVSAKPSPPQEDLSSPEVNAMGYDSSDDDSYEYDSSDDDSSDDDSSDDDSTDDDSTDDDSSDDDSTVDDSYEYAGPPYSSYPAYYSFPKEGSSGSFTDATALGYGLGFDLPYPIFP